MARVPLAIFNDVQPQNCSQPEGLSRKTAIHCVMLLDNNLLLPSSYALCLAVFRLSAIVNETSTDPNALFFSVLSVFQDLGFSQQSTGLFLFFILWLFSPWVSSVVFLCQVLVIEVGIDLGGGDAGVAKEFLHGAQVVGALQ